MRASCMECGLKTCILYNKKDVFTTMAEDDVRSDQVVRADRGLVIFDTGCRASVGGKTWHRGLRKQSRTLGKQYYSEEQLEFFQFCP